VPDIIWSADGNSLIWKLLSKLERPANHKTLAGTKKGEKTTGERKITIFQRIGEALFPDFYALEPRTVTDHTKAKTEWLISNYNKHAKRLQVTGGGIDNPEDEANHEDLPNQFMEFYIGATGLDDATPEHAKNLWGKLLIALLSSCTHNFRILTDIERQFPFFPRLHAI
ncbi:hypothetical protein FIBSPDRAFT_687819, partial [Athelia psychrophila]